MSGETGAPVGDQSGIPHSQCGAQVGAWHGYGCPQAREADDTDPSPHRHTLILEVRSRIHPPLSLPFCPHPILAPVLLTWTSTVAFTLVPQLSSPRILFPPAVARGHL